MAYDKEKLKRLDEFFRKNPRKIRLGDKVYGILLIFEGVDGEDFHMEVEGWKATCKIGDFLGLAESGEKQLIDWLTRYHGVLKAEDAVKRGNVDECIQSINEKKGESYFGGSLDARVQAGNVFALALHGTVLYADKDYENARKIFEGENIQRSRALKKYADKVLERIQKESKGETKKIGVLTPLNSEPDGPIYFFLGEGDRYDTFSVGTRSGYDIVLADAADNHVIYLPIQFDKKKGSYVLDYYPSETERGVHLWINKEEISENKEIELTDGLTIGIAGYKLRFNELPYEVGNIEEVKRTGHSITLKLKRGERVAGFDPKNPNPLGVDITRWAYDGEIWKLIKNGEEINVILADKHAYFLATVKLEKGSKIEFRWGLTGGQDFDVDEIDRWDEKVYDPSKGIQGNIPVHLSSIGKQRLFLLVKDEQGRISKSDPVEVNISKGG